MSEDEDWGDTAPQAPVQVKPKTEEEKAFSAKGDIDKKFKAPYKFHFKDVRKIKRVESSLFERGWAANSFVALIGLPGCGKSRLALQECIRASQQGRQSFYMFNETTTDNFNATIARVAESMGVKNDTDLSNITFWDASRLTLGTANYDSMDSVAERVWAGQLRKYIDKENPRSLEYVAFDSFSDICRKYVPQMPIFHKMLLTHLSDLYIEKEVSPVTFMIHQKSLSPREGNTEAVVGGYGINHESDMCVLLKLVDVDKWGADRYGWPEGSMIHTLQIPKDRYSVSDYMESVVVLKNGLLTLQDTVNSRVTARRVEKAAIKAGLSTDSNWDDDQ